MSSVAGVYAQALYDLTKENGASDAVLQQMHALDEGFRAEPDFIRLLCAANLTKAERCGILEDSFGGKIHRDLLSFLKILTEKGYMRHFSEICKAFAGLYNEEHGILEVRAVSAIALSQEQKQRLCQKLADITGKRISLISRVDPACLGGIRLDYDGKQVNDTLQHRLERIRSLLSETVL